MSHEKNNKVIHSSSGFRITLCTAIILSQAALPCYVWANPNVNLRAGQHSDSHITSPAKHGSVQVAAQDINIQEPIVADNTNITLESQHISTNGDKVYGAVVAKNGGHIIQTGGTVNATGERAYGLLAGNEGSITSSAVVTTIGAHAIGVQAGDILGSENARVELTQGSEINTGGGTDAYGLHAVYNGTIEGTTAITTTGNNGFGAFAESGSVINLHDSNITTSGTKAIGVLANNDDLKTNPNAIGGKVTMQGGSVTTGAYHTSGVQAEAGGDISLQNTAVTTEGEWAFGAFSQNGGQIELVGGTVNTSKLRAFGLLAGNEGLITSSANITTTGDKAAGVQAGEGKNNQNARIVLTDGSNVITGGADAYGLHAVYNGTIEGTTAITTTGNNGFGAFAESDSVINLHDSNIITTGANAIGVLANNDAKNIINEMAFRAVNSTGGKVTLKNSSVITKGANAAGVQAEAGGTIDLTNVAIRTEGAGSAAAKVSTGSTLSIKNSQLSSARGAGIALNDNATVTLDNTTIAATQQTLLSTLTMNAQQTIKVGAGSVATQNNGTLLQVNRQNGAAGTVALTLGQGSTTSGDIIDTNAPNGGGTDVTLERGATWSGLLRGVRNFFSLQTSTVNFTEKANIQGNLTATGSTYTFSPAGGSIAGNVTLNEGSSTHGGTINTPITVGGDVAIDNTSVFGGNWNIQGDVSNSGTITPGNSIGVVNIGGDLNLAPDSVYVAEVDSAGRADRINVAGTAYLDGVVEASPYDGMRLQNPYTILTAANGFDGSRFDSVTMNGDYAFISPTLTYGTNQVQLTIDRNDVAYASVAQTYNQRAVAGALDTVPVTGALGNLLALSTVDTARTAFNQLSGEIHASLKNALMEDSRPVRDAVNDRLHSVTDNDSDRYGNVWLQGYGANSGTSGSEGVADLHHSTGGVLLGADMRIAEHSYLGLLTGTGKSHFDTGSRDESGSSRNTHLGIYGGSAWGNLTFRAGVINSWNDVETNRHVGFNGVNEKLRGDYDARTLQTFGELGYRLQAGAVALEPFANLTHATLHTDAFSEKGGISALSADKQSMDTTWSTLGLKAGSTVTVGNIDMNVSGKAGWQRAWNDTTPYSTLSFEDSQAFSVKGTQIAKDTAVLEAGIGTDLSQTVSVGVAWAGQFGDDTHNNGVNATVKMKF